MCTLRSSALLFLFILSLNSSASGSELTLRFRSGHSVSDIKLKYYKNDIFILLRGDRAEELISVDSLIYIRREGSPHTGLGVIVGVVGGALVGGLIADLIDSGGGGHGDLGNTPAIASGIVLGGVIGGVAGGFVGGNIKSDETVDLSEAHLNEKLMH